MTVPVSRSANSFFVWSSRSIACRSKLSPHARRRARNHRPSILIVLCVMPQRAQRFVPNEHQQGRQPALDWHCAEHPAQRDRHRQLRSWLAPLCRHVLACRGRGHARPHRRRASRRPEPRCTCSAAKDWANAPTSQRQASARRRDTTPHAVLLTTMSRTTCRRRSSSDITDRASRPCAATASAPSS